LGTVERPGMGFSFCVRAMCLMVLGLGRLAQPLGPTLAPVTAQARERPRTPPQTRQIIEPARARGTLEPLIPTGIAEATRRGREGPWRPTEPYDETTLRVVDLVSGFPLGVARVSGPRSKLRLAHSVVRFAISFRDFFSIDIYVPISSPGPSTTPARVPGTGITALGVSALEPPHLTATRPGPARRPVSAGIFERYSGQMNSAINAALAQHGVGLSSATKVVPLFRPHSARHAVGAAQVTGPAGQLARVKAVAEVPLSLPGALRARGLIPVSTREVAAAEAVSGVAISAEARLMRP